MRETFLKEKQQSHCWGSYSQLIDYESDALPTAMGLGCTRLLVHVYTLHHDWITMKNPRQSLNIWIHIIQYYMGGNHKGRYTG